MTVNTSECEKCIYGSVDDSNKARVMVYCSKRDKSIYFGKTIDCDDKTIKKE